MTVEKINETLERLEHAGSGEVFDFVFPLMELMKSIVQSFENELIKPTRWVSMADLIKWFLKLMDTTFS